MTRAYCPQPIQVTLTVEALVGAVRGRLVVALAVVGDQEVPPRPVPRLLPGRIGFR